MELAAVYLVKGLEVTNVAVLEPLDHAVGTEHLVRRLNEQNGQRPPVLGALINAAQHIHVAAVHACVCAYTNGFSH